MIDDMERLVRARALRARVAEHEALRLRRAVGDAEAAVDEARRLLAGHVLQAAEASAMASSAGADATTRIGAAELQSLLDFAAGARFRAGQGVSVIRRADLVRERLQEDSDAAAEVSRRQVARHAAVAKGATQRRVAQDRRRVERDSEATSEEHATLVAVKRAREES